GDNGERAGVSGDGAVVYQRVGLHATAGVDEPIADRMCFHRSNAVLMVRKGEGPNHPIVGDGRDPALDPQPGRRRRWGAGVVDLWPEGRLDCGDVACGTVDEVRNA